METHDETKTAETSLHTWKFERQASATVENHNTVEKNHSSWDSLWQAGEARDLCNFKQYDLISSFKLET